MSMVRTFAVILPALAACTGTIQRSARVPHPGVPLSSGQPLTSTAEISAGLSNLGDFVNPKVGDATQAVEVPSTEMRDEVRFRIGDRAQLAMVYEHGFARTSQRPDPTQAPVGPGDVNGYGIAARYAFETSTPGFSIGTTLELMGWSVPYVEYRTCTDCPQPFTVSEHGRANPVSLGIGVAPSYRTGRVTYFGGGFARNHPTTLRKELDTDIFLDDHDGDVQNGPFNLLLHAGIEVELNTWLSAIAIVHQNVVADPVKYGPGVGFALSGRLGSYTAPR